MVILPTAPQASRGSVFLSLHAQRSLDSSSHYNRPNPSLQSAMSSCRPGSPLWSVQALPLCIFPCPAGEAALTILSHTDGTNGGLLCPRQRVLAELAPFSGRGGDTVQPWWGLAQPGAHLEEVGLDGEGTRVHGARLVYWSCEWAEHRRVAEGTGKARPSS